MIDANRISEIMKDVLYTKEELVGMKPGEIPEGCIVVNGIMNNFGFHPERLKSHEDEIVGMLEQLPYQFREKGTHEKAGGGWTFLNACADREDNLWGQHKDVEILFCLAIGLKRAQWVTPREMWGMFPGGMPYVSINVSDST